MDQPDRAVHSDFLIHWTGKDIDEKEQPDWSTSHHASKTNAGATTSYVERLESILKFGLWMTTEDRPEIISIQGKPHALPNTARCCFTELRLSESRRHAERYGRLGIGLKRPFAFVREGRPMVYFGFGKDLHRDTLLEACASDLKNKDLLNFFKPMNSNPNAGLTYDFYAESEWRILFGKSLLRNKLAIDPRNPSNAAEHAYFNSLPKALRDKLKYLLPLDGWLSMIIYPSIQVKNTAYWDTASQVRANIERIKRLPNDHANRVEGMPGQLGLWPIELDLDACKNF